MREHMFLFNGIGPTKREDSAFKALLGVVSLVLMLVLASGLSAEPTIRGYLGVFSGGVGIHSAKGDQVNNYLFLVRDSLPQFPFANAELNQSYYYHLYSKQKSSAQYTQANLMLQYGYVFVSFGISEMSSIRITPVPLFATIKDPFLKNGLALMPGAGNLERYLLVRPVSVRENSQMNLPIGLGFITPPFWLLQIFASVQGDYYSGGTSVGPIIQYGALIELRKNIFLRIASLNGFSGNQGLSAYDGLPTHNRKFSYSGVTFGIMIGDETSRERKKDDGHERTSDLFWHGHRSVIE